MASSGLKKMLDLIILYTLKSVSENVYLVILFLMPNKSTRKTFSDTLLIVYKIMRSNIFFRREEPMSETGESFSTESKLILF